MKAMKHLLSCLIIFLVLFIPSCKTNPKEKDAFIPVFSTYKNDSATTNLPVIKNEIFYGVLTPVEICEIFSRLNVPHNNSILNPFTKRDQYLSSSKAAINTGIYGVDFGYLKVFGIGQEVIDYMVTIREMSNKLGIPDSYLTDPIKRVQSDIADPDTIMIQS